MSILSISFFVVFVCFFFIYWRFRYIMQTQNLILLCANYAFYASTNWKFCILLLFTTLSTYFSAILLCSYSKSILRRFILICNVVINIGILFVFKYYNFFAGELASFFSLNPNDFYIKLLLPVGISFYTFTAIGAIIDIYRNSEIQHNLGLVPFMTFISFFPLIMSGPIERSTGLLAQIRKSRNFDTSLITEDDPYYANFSWDKSQSATALRIYDRKWEYFSDKYTFLPTYDYCLGYLRKNIN